MRRLPTPAPCARALPRLRDESGVALVMALGIMLVLTIALATAIAFTSAGARHANSSNAGQKAFALAEAGLSNASSIIFSAQDPTVSTALPSGSQSIGGGTTSWSGSLAGTTWTLTGTGTVPNPSAPGGTVTRTVTKQLALVLQPSLVWSYNYSDATTGCMNVTDHVLFKQPLYVRGNLCINDNSHFTGKRLQVKGTLNIGSNSSVGCTPAFQDCDPAGPIDDARLAGGCLPGPVACKNPPHKVYANSITQTVDDISKPPVDMAYWYQNAKPGPKQACTTGSVSGGFDTDATFNNSRGTFNLTPGSNYSCVVKSGSTTIGELSWNSSTKVLKIAGTIFFDGPITVTSGVRATYQGQATIYAAGKITFENESRLCGVAACNETWNPTQNLLVFVAGKPAPGDGLVLSDNVIYQGAAYVVADYRSGDNAANWGPVIANQLYVSNNQAGYVPINVFPAGTPGYRWTLQEVPGSWTG